jgi:hypothetical protein
VFFSAVIFYNKVYIFLFLFFTFSDIKFPRQTTGKMRSNVTHTNVLCILHVGKNVRVKLEKKIIITCNLGTLLFYTLISSNRMGRQINRAGHPTDKPSQFWQQSMYYPFMNYYITELTARLLENGGSVLQIRWFSGCQCCPTGLPPFDFGFKT